MIKKIVVIDGNGLMHRAFHATPPLSNKKYGQINALYGFCSTLLQLQQKLHTDHLIVALDFPAKTFRDDLFLQYRSQRPATDSNLKSQFPLLKNILREANIPHYETQGFEADDIIASIVNSHRFDNHEKLIFSADKDLFQLVNESTKIILPTLKSNSEYEFLDSKQIVQKIGVSPKQIIFYKSLCGDPSDNYKGIAGIGPRGAVAIIQKWGTVENLLQNWDKLTADTNEKKLLHEKETLLLGIQLATLKSDLILPSEIYQIPEQNQLLENLRPVLEEFQFASLLRRFYHIDTKPKNSLQPDLFSL